MLYLIKKKIFSLYRKKNLPWGFGRKRDAEIARRVESTSVDTLIKESGLCGTFILEERQMSVELCWRLVYFWLWLTLCSRSFSRRSNSSILALETKTNMSKKRKILINTLASSSRFLRLSSTCDRWSVSRLRNCNHFLTLSNCCCCLKIISLIS